jgi:CRP-like cAMP-binding protein
MNCPVKDPIDQTLANTVIAALPARARQNLLADASFVEMQSPGVLACAGTPMAHAWFPTTGVISVLTPQAHGRTLEIDMIGFESVLDAGCALGVAAPAFDAEVQVTGHAWCIETRALAAHMQTSTILRNALVRRLYLSLAKVGQRSVCSSFHTLQQQLCRWLLMSQDRSGSPDVLMTHERLARLLGVRRAGISTAAGLLQAAGLIRYLRGHILVLDRPGLLAGSCECYAQDLATQRALVDAPALCLTG